MSVEDSGPTARRGWGCTPTGDPPLATVSSEDTTRKGCLATIFTAGWRRTALYGILVFLMLLIFLNIALTLWIVGALKLSMNGVGPIRIVRGGIQLDGQAWVVDNLVASRITSQHGQPITLHSHRNFTVKVAEPDRVEHSKLFIKRDILEFSGRVLNVRDARGENVFTAARDEVRVFADTLSVDGPGGVIVRSAVQVPHVHAPPASNLTLESLTRRLDLKAPQSITLESRAGSIDIMSHGNINLNSLVGAASTSTSSKWPLQQIAAILPMSSKMCFKIINGETPITSVTLATPVNLFPCVRPHEIQVDDHGRVVSQAFHSGLGGEIAVAPTRVKIRFDASNIIINHLKEAVRTDKPQKNLKNVKVFQLCACTTGKLFLAAPEAPCAIHEDDTEFCR